MKRREQVVLWTGRRRGDRVRAVMRSVPEGFELRLLWSNRQLFEHVYADADTLRAAANRRRTELDEHGWTIIST
jgi:hypothetical protein